MVPEARLEQTEAGLVPKDDGWFVVNAKDARWYDAAGRSAVCPFEGDSEFEQLGFNLYVLGAGESMGMYHWEAVQEDFLVLAGEGLLLVEGQERPLGPWDFVHCPPQTRHIIVGAGNGPCIVVAVGLRDDSLGDSWGGYPVDEFAQRHGVGVEQETSDAHAAYAHLPRRQPTPYRPDWLG